MSIRSATSTPSASRLSFTRPSALEAATAIATAGLAAVLAYVVASSVDAPEVAAIGGIVGLVIAGLVLLGRRWTPALGTFFALIVAFLVIVPDPDAIVRTLAGGAADPLYTPFVLLPPLLVLGLVSGIGGTIQNVRHVAVRHSATRRFAPRWLTPLAATLAGVALGGLLLGAAARPAQTPAGINPAVLGSLPGLRASGFAFDQPEIQARVGETVALRLENSDSVTHTFTVDDLGVDVPIVPGQTSVALFRPTAPGTYTFYCVPHFDRATGQGMHGTLIVE